MALIGLVGIKSMPTLQFQPIDFTSYGLIEYLLFSLWITDANILCDQLVDAKPRMALAHVGF